MRVAFASSGIAVITGHFIKLQCLHLICLELRIISRLIAALWNTSVAGLREVFESLRATPIVDAHCAEIKASFG